MNLSLVDPLRYGILRDPSDIHICHICNEQFEESDTFWKVSCIDCHKPCCFNHRADENPPDYDARSRCFDCLTCKVCSVRVDNISRCGICDMNVCDEHIKKWCGREGCVNHIVENHRYYSICDNCYPERTKLPVIPYEDFTNRESWETEIKKKAYYLWLGGAVGDEVSHYYEGLKQYLSHIYRHLS